MTHWRVLTPLGSSGGVAIVELWPDPDAALDRLGLRPVPVGAIVVRDLPGGDRGLIARWREDSVVLMPHAGAQIMRRLLDALTASGMSPGPAVTDPRGLYPEAGDAIEAAALEALSRAPSPRAVDLLLDQHQRWRRRGAEGEPARDVALNRLLHPPLVMVLGPANIGKSTLVNTLARFGVSIVGPEPGTTRDHIGALATVDGLVIRLIDTPGLRPEADEIERRAIAIVDAMVPTADLILLCGDAAAPPPPPPPSPQLPPPSLAALSPAGRPTIRLGLRSDLGVPDWPWDLTVCAPSGGGIEELAVAIRRALVPDEALLHAGPWRFWGDDPPYHLVPPGTVHHG